MFKRVVLPHPLGPKMLTNSDSRNFKSRPFKALTVLVPDKYFLVIFLVLTYFSFLDHFMVHKNYMIFLVISQYFLVSYICVII